MDPRIAVEEGEGPGLALAEGRPKAGSVLKTLEESFSYQKWDMPPHLLKACVSCTNQTYRKSDLYNLDCRGHFDAEYAQQNAGTVCVLVMESNPSKRFYMHSLVLNSQSEFFQSMSSFMSARAGEGHALEPATINIPDDITRDERFVQTLLFYMTHALCFGVCAVHGFAFTHSVSVLDTAVMTHSLCTVLPSFVLFPYCKQL